MNAVARVCVITFSAAVGAILLSAVLVTSANSQGHALSLRAPFRLLCHGISDRCLQIRNTPMPICSRCVGIYAGGLAGLGLFAATSRRWSRELDSPAVILLVSPLVIDGVTQAMGLRESTNELRLVTGFVAGMAGMAWVLSRMPREFPLNAGGSGEEDASRAAVPP